MADDAPFLKQALPQRRGRPARAAQYAGLNPENACKWHTLNKLFKPDDAEWEAAAAAGSWDSDRIVDRIRVALDTAWTIEQARTARQQAELKQQEQRVIRQQQRTEQRHQQARPLKKFLRSKNLSIVHESTKPAEPDELETENPLSLAYKGRRKRKRGEEGEELEESPPVDEELAEEAAERGVLVVSPHKKKRQALAGVDPDAVAAAEEALAQLPTAAASVLLEKVAKKGGPSKAAAVGGQGGAKKGGGQAAAARVDNAKLLKTYYEKKLKEINDLRKKQKHGPLNKAGRKDLKKFCGYHYKDVEHGFAGSLAAPWWNKYVTDWKKFPDAEEDDEEDTETEDEGE